jgi:hypothetical protein
VDYTSKGPNNELVLLSTVTRFTMDVRVANIGEPAYTSNITVKYPSFLEYTDVVFDQSDGQTHVSCAEYESDVDGTINADGKTHLGCGIGDPIPANTEVRFTLKFSIGADYTPSQLGNINMDVRAATYSSETDMNDNSKVINIPVRTRVQTEFTGYV